MDPIGYAFSIIISISAVLSLLFNFSIILLSISDIKIQGKFVTFLLIQLCCVLMLYDISTLPMNMKWSVTFDPEISKVFCQIMGLFLNTAITMFPGAVVMRYLYFYETVVLNHAPRLKLWLPLIIFHFLVILSISLSQVVTQNYIQRGTYLQCTTPYYKIDDPIAMTSTILLIFLNILAAIIHLIITFKIYYRMKDLDARISNKTIKGTKDSFYSPMMLNLKVLRSEVSVGELGENNEADINELTREIKTQKKRHAKSTSISAPLTPHDVLYKYFPVTIVYFISGGLFISLPIFELTSNEPSSAAFDYVYALIYSISKFYVVYAVINKNPSIKRGFQVSWHYFIQSLKRSFRSEPNA